MGFKDKMRNEVAAAYDEWKARGKKITKDPEPDPENWRDIARYCVRYGERLHARQMEFLNRMAHQVRDPSPKQWEWLNGIFNRVRHPDHLAIKAKGIRKGPPLL